MRCVGLATAQLSSMLGPATVVPVGLEQRSAGTLAKRSKKQKKEK
jgi:hypothetical protein